uniref:Uncharacterized protein n=2 Tax=Plectus sambesii TaxID=2011161 RepID=A0A914UQZ6_9BILA
MTQLSLLAAIFLFSQSSALVCDSYHSFREEGKLRQIISSICGARNTGYCVKVTYWDSDWRKKRGFSGGCDANDCAGLASGNKTIALEWGSDGCRKHLDYGSEGEICCCNDRDRCNAARHNYWTFSLLTLSTVVTFLVSKLSKRDGPGWRGALCDVGDCGMRDADRCVFLRAISRVAVLRRSSDLFLLRIPDAVSTATDLTVFHRKGAGYSALKWRETAGGRMRVGHGVWGEIGHAGAMLVRDDWTRDVAPVGRRRPPPSVACVVDWAVGGVVKRPSALRINKTGCIDALLRGTDCARRTDGHGANAQPPARLPGFLYGPPDSRKSALLHRPIHPRRLCGNGR